MIKVDKDLNGNPLGIVKVTKQLVLPAYWVDDT
jgi:hypothetical protein